MGHIGLFSIIEEVNGRIPWFFRRTLNDPAISLPLCFLVRVNPMCRKDVLEEC
jgi:hypothetical protein